MWRGSAGSVLRSQGSSEEDGAFALRARGRLDRFQCLLRTDPAPPRRGVGLTYLHKRGHSLLLLMGPSCQRVGEKVRAIVGLWRGSAGPVLLLPWKVDLIRTMGEATLDGAGGERSLFWGRWRVSIAR